jgi:hypothetical protein
VTERHDTTLVLWDIDHTLIENAGVSKKNYADSRWAIRPMMSQGGLTGGSRVIAVATGTFTAEQLRAAGADVVLSDLAEVDAFVAALLAVRGLGPSDLGLSRPEHRIGPR